VASELACSLVEDLSENRLQIGGIIRVCLREVIVLATDDDHPLAYECRCPMMARLAFSNSPPKGRRVYDTLKGKERHAARGPSREVKLRPLRRNHDYACDSLIRAGWRRLAEGMGCKKSDPMRRATFAPNGVWRERRT